MRRLIAEGGLEDQTEVDMTPMLDVVFILLIFFIVTATFLKETGLDMNQPDIKDKDTLPVTNNIDIRIEESGRIWINDTSGDIHSVKPSVMRLHAQNPKAKVIIRPDAETRTDILIQVFDQVRATNVAVAIEKPEESK